MASAGEIKIKISAAVDKFKANMLAATRTIRKFEKTTRKANKKIIASFKAMSSGVGKALRKLKGAFISVAAAGASIFGGVNIVNNFAKAGREIDNWSKTLKISTTDLQKFAAAAETVKFSFEKVTDILKDVSDKIGDFVATGGGEAKDLFARLGLGKLALAGKDPAKALSMIVDQMERLGNVSNQEKVFLFEAIANDTSKLIPILANGGKLLKQFGAEAEKAGAIITPDELKRLAQFQSISRVIGMQWQGIKKVFTLGVLPATTELAAKIKQAFKTGDIKKFANILAGKISNGIKHVANNMPAIISGFTSLGKAVLTVASALTTVVTRMKEIVTLKMFDGIGGAISEQMAKLNLGGFKTKDRSATNLKNIEKRMRAKADLGSSSNPARASTGKWVTVTDEFGKSITKLVKPVATMAQSAEQLKAAVTGWQKGQDKANKFIADPTRASYAQGVIDRSTRDPKQAQDSRFDRIANSIRRDARDIQDKGGKISPREFSSRIQDLVDLSERVRGGNTTNTGMKDVISTLRNLGKAKPGEKVAKAEIKIKLDPGLLAEMIEQNPDSIKLILAQEFSKASSKVGK